MICAFTPPTDAAQESFYFNKKEIKEQKSRKCPDASGKFSPSPQKETLGTKNSNTTDGGLCSWKI